MGINQEYLKPNSYISRKSKKVANFFLLTYTITDVMITCHQHVYLYPRYLGGK